MPENWGGLTPRRAYAAEPLATARSISPGAAASVLTTCSTWCTACPDLGEGGGVGGDQLAGPAPRAGHRHPQPGRGPRVDAEVAARITTCGVTRIDRAVDRAAATDDPAALAAREARARRGGCSSCTRPSRYGL